LTPWEGCRSVGSDPAKAMKNQENHRPEAR
jgi:hypothetical protein